MSQRSAPSRRHCPNWMHILERDGGGGRGGIGVCGSGGHCDERLIHHGHLLAIGSSISPRANRVSALPPRVPAASLTSHLLLTTEMPAPTIKGAIFKPPGQLEQHDAVIFTPKTRIEFVIGLDGQNLLTSAQTGVNSQQSSFSSAENTRQCKHLPVKSN